MMREEELKGLYFECRKTPAFRYGDETFRKSENLVYSQYRTFVL